MLCQRRAVVLCRHAAVAWVQQFGGSIRNEHAASVQVLPASLRPPVGEAGDDLPRSQSSRHRTQRRTLLVRKHLPEQLPRKVTGAPALRQALRLAAQPRNKPRRALAAADTIMHAVVTCVNL